jgi:hypothetical protein
MDNLSEEVKRSVVGGKGKMPVFIGCTFPLESEFLSPIT